VLDADPRFEVVVRPQLSTLVFRYAPAQHTIPPRLCDRANLYAREATTAPGAVMAAATVVDGRHYLKFILLNPRTTLEDTTTALDPLAGHAQAFLGESSHVSDLPVPARLNSPIRSPPHRARHLAEPSRARLRRHRSRPLQPRPRLPGRPDRRARSWLTSRTAGGCTPSTSARVSTCCTEYVDYCGWAAVRVPNVRFDRDVTVVEYDGALLSLSTNTS
jgi:hypothetical protein